MNGIRRICTLPSRSETNRSGMKTIPLLTTAPIRARRRDGSALNLQEGRSTFLAVISAVGLNRSSANSSKARGASLVASRWVC